MSSPNDHSPAAEKAELSWQVANGSPTAHVIDPARPSWHNPDGSRRRNGPRSLCGRYPQRNADGTWWEWPVSQTRADTGRGFMIRFCEDCRDALSETSTSPEQRGGLS